MLGSTQKCSSQVSGHDCHQLVLLNWSAPCTIPKEMESTQVATMSWALQDDMNSAAVMVSPCFAYSKGKLHLEEKKMFDTLSKCPINLDCSFAIIFTEQQDSRDERPLVYNGRLMTPAPVDFNTHPFWKCDLRKNRRTADIRQLDAKKLKIVEDQLAELKRSRS